MVELQGDELALEPIDLRVGAADGAQGRVEALDGLLGAAQRHEEVGELPDRRELLARRAALEHPLQVVDRLLLLSRLLGAARERAQHHGGRVGILRRLDHHGLGEVPLPAANSRLRREHEDLAVAPHPVHLGAERAVQVAEGLAGAAGAEEMLAEPERDEAVALAAIPRHLQGRVRARLVVEASAQAREEVARERGGFAVEGGRHHLEVPLGHTHRRGRLDAAGAQRVGDALDDARHGHGRAVGWGRARRWHGGRYACGRA